MVFFVKDAWVWLEHAAEAWLPVQLIEQNGDKILCKSQLGEEFSVDASKDMPNVAPSSLQPCDNMVSLEELSEGAILHNLRMRYEKDQIYTYISSILISVNPFKMLSIYSPSTMDEYRRKMRTDEYLAPHVYALADNTFRSLVEDKTPQSVIISGESGAGKTEATKLVLQYLAEMSGQGSAIEQQLLQANPIIEAFGNAKTVRNNNSSRFGKWIEVKFNRDFHISGATISNYLLEKSRIVHLGPSERNYHAFYQLCAGASDAEKSRYHLGPASSFKYCSAGDCLVVENMNDADMYHEMVECLKSMEFKADETDFLLTIVASVLHLGNLEFKDSGVDQCQLTSDDALAHAASLLKIDTDGLQKALVTRNYIVAGETIVSPLNAEKARNGRDALAKAVYSATFDWLINRINNTLSAQVGQAGTTSVGVLDIFGFESFETNRFEQFCINYANEKLQQHFNHHIFTMEQKEYAAENIDVAHVDFVDNQPCLDLIEKPKVGIMSLTDEELRIPKGSDLTLLGRMDQKFKDNEYYIARKMGNPVFTIAHYAGSVAYLIDGFLEKNKDSLEDNLTELISKSGNHFISALFASGSVSAATATKTGGRGGGGAQKATLGSQFKAQLTALMSSLNSTAPHFIRCIKPNTQKAAEYFDAQMVSRQLRYLGIQEVVKIRQLGYPVRSEHHTFFARYKVLGGAEAKDAQGLLESMPDIRAQDWRVGTSKVFIRQSVHTKLEKRREARITGLMVKVQALARMRMWRKRYRRIRAVKQALVKALDEAKDHAALDKAIDEYVNLGFNTDEELVNKARARAKVLYEHAQAARSLEAALESRDESLLQTALQGAKKVGLDPNTPAFVAANSYYTDLVAWKESTQQAIKARDLAALQTALATAAKIKMQDSSLASEAQTLVNRIQEEQKAEAALQAAVQSRDLASLQNAIKVAKDLRLAADVIAPAVALEQSILAAQKALTDLGKAVESKSPDRDVLERRVAAAVKTGVAETHELVGQARQIIARLVEEEKQVHAKEAFLSKVKETATNATGSGDLDTLRAALKKCNDATAQYEADAKALGISEVAAQLEAAVAKLEKREAVREQLRRAVDTRHLEKLDAAIGAALGAGLAKDPLNEEAKRIRANIRKCLSDLDILAKEKNIKGLSEALSKAKDDVSKDSPEWATVEKFEKERDVLVHEEETRNALQFAMRSRNESMLNVAMNKAKATGVTDNNKELMKEAEMLTETIEEEDMVREQELVVAQRKRTVAVQQRDRRATRSRRPTVLDPKSAAAQAVPEEKHAGGIVAEIESGKSWVDEKVELFRFPNLRSPAEYASGKLFGKGALKAGMLHFTQDVIPTSLTRVIVDLVTEEERKYEKQLVHESVQMFKSIQGFMGDRHYSFPDALAADIIKSCIATPLLRDEYFIQLQKQLRKNTKPESVLRGWQLVALGCEHFPPSEEFMPYLLHFLQTNMTMAQHTPEVRNYANYSVGALVATLKALGRSETKEPPTIEYITSFKDRQMTSGKVFVYFLDHSAVMVNIDPDTTVEQVIERVRVAINLQARDHGFGLFEVVRGNKNYLPPSSKICDYETAKQDATVAVATAVDDAKLIAKLLEPPPTQFLFAKRMYLGGAMATDLAKDPIGVALMYYQAVEEVSRGNYFVPIADAATLSVIHEHVTKKVPLALVAKGFADKNRHVYQAMSLRPPGVLFTSGKVTKKKFEEMCNTERAKLSDQTRVTDYLRVVSKYPLYGAQFFTVQQTDTPWLPQTLIVGINMGGVYLMDWNTRDLLSFFPIQAIAGWKGTAAVFIVRCQMEMAKWFNADLGAKANKKGLQTFYLKTEQGKYVADLVRAYVNALIALVKKKQRPSGAPPPPPAKK